MVSVISTIVYVVSAYLHLKIKSLLNHEHMASRSIILIVLVFNSSLMINSLKRIEAAILVVVKSIMLFLNLTLQIAMVHYFNY